MRREEAIAALRPGAHWVLRGDALTWLDDRVTPPSETDILAKMAEALPRSAFGADLFGVLTKAEHAMLAGARADDLRIITARGQDMIPETNAKLARLAAVAGLSVADWFGRLP